MSIFFDNDFLNLSDFNSTSMWEEMTYFFRRLFNSHQKNGPLAKPSDVHVYLGAHDVDQLDYSTERIGVKEIFAADGKSATKLQQIDAYIFDGEISSDFFHKDQMICALGGGKDTGPDSPPIISSLKITDGLMAVSMQQYIVLEELFLVTISLLTRYWLP
ncbi:hypothetical protein D918_00329 [Trichuris suis]|nr:hypothetical protein D918_00329 [Trichuris suis]